MAVQIVAMGIVFGIIFKTPLFEYLPFLASSIILFGLISSIVTEGCMAFINAEAIIKQLNISIFVHVIRVVLKNLFTFAHNLVLIPLVFLAVWRGIGWESLLFVPGLILVLLNTSWMVVILGTVSARFRDLPQVVAAFMTIVYFVTPVMWQPKLVPPETAHWLLGLNPFYHLLQLLRLPFLSVQPTFENWFVSIVLAIAGWTGALLVVRRFGKQIAYWV
jgi:lipopolysaccharide transport system permease protein